MDIISARQEATYCKITISHNHRSDDDIATEVIGINFLGNRSLILRQNAYMNPSTTSIVFLKSKSIIELTHDIKGTKTLIEGGRFEIPEHCLDSTIFPKRFMNIQINLDLEGTILSFSIHEEPGRFDPEMLALKTRSESDPPTPETDVSSVSV